MSAQHPRGIYFFFIVRHISFVRWCADIVRTFCGHISPGMYVRTISAIDAFYWQGAWELGEDLLDLNDARLLVHGAPGEGQPVQAVVLPRQTKGTMHKLQHWSLLLDTSGRRYWCTSSSIVIFSFNGEILGRDKKFRFSYIFIFKNFNVFHFKMLLYYFYRNWLLWLLEFYFLSFLFLKYNNNNIHRQSPGVLGDWILQPSGILHRDAPGGDPPSQGLGPRQCYMPGFSIWSTIILP